MNETVLDRAHGAMSDAPEDEAFRLRFYERLVDAELFVLLEAEAAGETVRPKVFPLEDGPVVLAFDREERLATFVGGAADHVELTGRALMPMLSGAGLGLGLNLGVAPSEFLLPASAVNWLSGLLEASPTRREGVPSRVSQPRIASEALLRALDAKLPGLAGFADHALLAEAEWPDGDGALVLAFVGAKPGTETALARAAGEALIFSGLDEGALDVTFLDPGPVADRFARVGLRFDLPAPETPGSTAPGTDPAAPPRLR